MMMMMMMMILLLLHLTCVPAHLRTCVLQVAYFPKNVNFKI